MAKKKSRGQDEAHREVSKAGTARLPAGVPTVPVVGLVNLGNTCFLNSVLQLLASCEDCTAVLLQRSGPGQPAPGKGPLGFALQQAIMHMHGGTSTGGAPQGRSHQGAYNPQALHAALVRAVPQFKGYQQHDAQEALHALLDNIHEEAVKLHAMLHRPSSRRSSREAPAPGLSPSISSPTLCSTADSPAVCSSTVAVPQGEQGQQASASGLPAGCSIVGPVSPTPEQPGAPAMQRLPDAVAAEHPERGSQPAQTAEELEPIVPEPVSLTSVLFRGTLLSTVTCNTCGHASASSEAFLELSLPIPDKQHLQQIRSSSNLANLYALASNTSAPPSCTDPQPVAADCNTADTAASTAKQPKKKGSKIEVKVKAGKSKAPAGKAEAAAESKAASSKEPATDGKGPEAAVSSKTAQASKAPKETPKERKKRLAEERQAAIQARRQAKKQHHSSDKEDTAGSSAEQESNATRGVKKQDRGLSEEDVAGGTAGQEATRQQEAFRGEEVDGEQGAETEQEDAREQGCQEGPPDEQQGNSQADVAQEKIQVQQADMQDHGLLQSDSWQKQPHQLADQQEPDEVETQSGQQRHANSSLSTFAASSIPWLTDKQQPDSLDLINGSSAGSVTCTYISGFDVSPSRVQQVAGASRSSSNVSTVSTAPCVGQLSELLKQSQRLAPAGSDTTGTVPMADHTQADGLPGGGMRADNGLQHEHTGQSAASGPPAASVGSFMVEDKAVPAGQQQQLSAYSAADEPCQVNAAQSAVPVEQVPSQQIQQEEQGHGSLAHSMQRAGVFTVRPTVPHLVDCLASFFQPEPIMWDCPKEKQEARSAFEQLSEQVLSQTPPHAALQSASPLDHVLNVLHTAQSMSLSPSTPLPAPTPVHANGTSPEANAQHVAEGVGHGQQILGQPLDAGDSSVQNLQQQHYGFPMLSPQLGFASKGFCLDSPQKSQQVLASPPQSTPLPLQLGSPHLSLQRSLLGPLSPGQSLLGPLSPCQSLPLATSLSQLVKKKVRFSPLPPTVHHIPGSREQRGTDLEAALRGDVPFSRPARAPLPADMTAPSAMRAALRASQNSGKNGKGKKGRGNKGDAGEGQEEGGKAGKGGRGKRSGSGKGEEEGPNRFLKQEAAEEPSRSSKGKKKDRGQGKDSKAEGGKKKGGKKKKQDLSGDDAESGSSGDETNTSHNAKEHHVNGLEAAGRPGSQTDTENGDDQWLEGAAQQLSVEDSGNGGIDDADSSASGQQQVYVKGLLIEAQLDAQDLNMLKVRLVPGSTSDAKQVAAVMPKGRRGAALCRANIKAAWHYHAASKLAEGSINTDVTALGSATAETASSTQAATKDDSAGGSSDEKEVKHGHTQAEQAQQSSPHRGYNPSWLSESEAETDEGERLQEEVMCDVCDAVQVVMDCAAHMVLIKGVLAATCALGGGEPLSVLHEAGEWRVHGHDNDTKLPWVYPALHTSSSETATHSSCTTPLPTTRPDSPRLACPGVHHRPDSPGLERSNSHTGPIAAAAAGTAHVSDISSSGHSMAASMTVEGPAAGQGLISNGCTSDAITPRLLGGHEDQQAGAADMVPDPEETDNKTATPADAASGAVVQPHAGVAIPAGVPQACSTPIAVRGSAGSSSSPQLCGSYGSMPGTSPAGSGSRLKKPADSVFRRPATKAYTLEATPRVLLLHLKRFHQKGGGSVGVWAKLDSHVDVPLELDISHFMACSHSSHQAGSNGLPSSHFHRESETSSSSSAEQHSSTRSAAEHHSLDSSGTEQRRRYSLVGLVEHQGSLRFGHYVAYVRRTLQQQAQADGELSSSNGSKPENISSGNNGLSAENISARGGHGSTHTHCNGNGIAQAAGDVDIQQEIDRGSSAAGAAGGASSPAQACSIDGTSGLNTHGMAGLHAQWYRISDASVTRVSEQQVLSAQAYLLMYVQEGHGCANA